MITNKMCDFNRLQIGNNSRANYLLYSSEPKAPTVSAFWFNQSHGNSIIEPCNTVLTAMLHVITVWVSHPTCNTEMCFWTNMDYLW